jgi:hypothetical protein
MDGFGVIFQESYFKNHCPLNDAGMPIRAFAEAVVTGCLSQGGLFLV